MIAANLEKRQLDYNWVLTDAPEEVPVEEDKTRHKRKKKKE